MQTSRNIIAVLVFLLVNSALAVGQTTAQERARRLHTQLEELLVKQSELQERLEILEERLKAENIERSLAGVGSTRPEDLRELRRRQLETEKVAIQKQMAILSDSRVRLESGIAQADADAYHQSAVKNDPAEKPALTSSSVSKRPRKSALKKKVRPRRANR